MLLCFSALRFTELCFKLGRVNKIEAVFKYVLFNKIKNIVRFELRRRKGSPALTEGKAAQKTYVCTVKHKLHTLLIYT